MDIGEVNGAVGDRITLVGNVDCAELLPRGTEEVVVGAVKETIAKASPGGGQMLPSFDSVRPAFRITARWPRSEGVW
jgi:hypothetical protein